MRITRKGKGIIICTFLLLITIGCWWVLTDIQHASDYCRLGDNYVHDDYDICYIDSNENLRLIVPDNVCNYMYDENYIIAYQKPSFVVADYFWKYGTDYNSDSINELKQKCTRIGNCYWIICKKTQEVYGPMRVSDFNRKCKEMNITIKMDKRYESQN